MSLGNNIGYLRKQMRLTQEQLADRMRVSRQTVSRWEADEVTPELGKLVELCVLFSCKLDVLVREDLAAREKIYSEVAIRRVPAFRMALYTIISANPEDDALRHIERWGRESGLLAADPKAKLIGWDFPYVSQEQQTRFGFHGYTAAYMLPGDFVTDCPGAAYCDNREADYAVITVTEPHIQPFERIPNGYKLIMEHLQANSFKEKTPPGVLACFEYEYEKDGVHCMDIHVHVDSVVRSEAWNQFS